MEVRKESDIDENFMAVYADFKSPVFSACNNQSCSLSPTCFRYTIKNKPSDIITNMKSNEPCDNYWEDLQVKYALGRKKNGSK